MAGVTVGIESLYYAIMTPGTDTFDTPAAYGTPKHYAGTIQLTTAPTTNTATLYADNKAVEVATAFGDIPVTLNMTDLPDAVAADLLGSEIDENGVLVSAASDNAPFVAIGFRALKSNGAHRYVWLLKGKFQPDSTDLSTKTDTPTFQTPTLNATFIPRENDAQWRYRVDADKQGVPAEVIENWFDAVYDGTPIVP